MLQPPETTAERDLRRLRTMHRALGDASRLRVIGVLAEHGPLPVNELAARVDLSQPLISWHLRILRLAGLVHTRRQGRETISRLRLEGFDELHEAEERLVSGQLTVARTRPAAAPEVADVG